MKAGIIAIKNREAEHQRMEDEANALKSRDSEIARQRERHLDHENADAFWEKVKTTQATNVGDSVVNLNTVVEDATLHFAREARKAKTITFWVEDGFYVINPKSQEKMIWDLFTAAFITYSVLMVPFRLGFAVEDTALDIIDISVDVVFWLDMILSFITGYKSPDTSKIETDHVKICLHYIKGWFAVDFFSTFPTYRIARALAAPGSDPSATRSFQLIRALRLIRLLKLARLLKLKKLTRYLRDAEINPGFLRIGSLVGKILFVAHLFACLWHGVGIESQDLYGESWIVEFRASSETLAGRYVMSLHFTVATMMAVGYGDVYAITTLERAFAILAQIVGALVFGWILATVAVFYESADPRTAEIMRRTKKLQAFMRDRGLPKKIQAEILQAFEYRYAHKSVFDEASVLNSVSTTLGNKIVAEAYRQTIAGIPFLNKADMSLCSLLCREMRPMHMHQDRTVYEAGRMSPGLFMIKNGVVGAFLILNKNQNLGLTLGQDTSIADDNEDEVKKNNGDNAGPSFKDRNDTSTTFVENPNEAIISVFDEGSHFGHDSSICVSDKFSKVKLRVAKSCDLLLVPGDAIQRLIESSEQFRKYLQEDAFNRQKTIDGAIENYYNDPNSYVPLYNGSSAEQNTTADEDEKQKKQAGIERGDPVLRRRLSLKLARQASLRFDARGENGNKTDLNVSKIITKKSSQVVPLHDDAKVMNKKNDYETLIDPLKRMKKTKRFECERLLSTVSIDDREKYTFDKNDKFLITWETFESLLKLKFIHPSYGPKVKFDMLVAVLIIWSVIILPYRIAFDDLPTWESAAGAYLFEWIVDFIFFLDIILSFRTCYIQSGEKIFVASSKKIAHNYIQTWFTVDILSTLPLDLMIEGILKAINPASADGEQDLEALKLIRIVRLIRLIKLARLFKLGKTANSVADFIDSPYLLSLVTLLLMTVFVSHLLGCFWFLIAPYDTTDPTRTWWGTTMLASTKAEHYIASVYWSFSTMTTVGYGDIVPTNTVERLYACAAMIAGATIFGYVVGNVASMSMTADIVGMRKQEKINNVLGYMREKNIGKKLRLKVENYLEFYFEQCSGFEDTSLIDELPEQLKCRVHEFLYGPSVDRFSAGLFKHTRRDAATRIVSKLRTEVFVKGDIIFREGEIGDAMYLVERGTVLCIINIETKEEKCIRKQIEGSHFAQYSMLKEDIPHPFTAVVSESTVVLVMSRANVGIMVEEEAMLGQELEKLFTEHIRFNITSEQRKHVGEDGSPFSVSSRINKILLDKFGKKNGNRNGSGSSGSSGSSRSGGGDVVPSSDMAESVDSNEGKTIFGEKQTLE
jgi:hypothetical protein